VQSVYSAVRAESLYDTDTFRLIRLKQGTVFVCQKYSLQHISNGTMLGLNTTQ